MRYFLATILLLVISVVTAYAGEADVVKVEVIRGSDSSYQFHVTVFHQDEGWQHYADKWDIVDPDGVVLATRILQHPHTGEQPFIRSLSGVKIPGETSQVTVRAHDSVHEYGGKTVIVDIPRE